MDISDLFPAETSDAAMLSVIIGFFLPLVLNFLISVKWTPALKSLVAFVVSAVVGVLVALATGAYAGLGIPSIILLTFVVAITVYKGWWKQVAPTMQSKVGIGTKES